MLMRWFIKIFRSPSVAFDSVRWVVSRRPGLVLAFWFTLAALVFLLAPDLTRLAAEGQANLLPQDSESGRAADLVRQEWPDQWYDSLAVAALYREGGLTALDRDYARRLADRFLAPGKPGERTASARAWIAAGSRRATGQ